MQNNHDEALSFHYRLLIRLRESLKKLGEIFQLDRVEQHHAIQTARDKGDRAIFNHK